MDKIKNERYAHCLTNTIQLPIRKHTWAWKSSETRKLFNWHNLHSLFNQETQTRVETWEIHTYHLTENS